MKIEDLTSEQLRKHRIGNVYFAPDPRPAWIEGGPLVLLSVDRERESGVYYYSLAHFKKFSDGEVGGAKVEKLNYTEMEQLTQKGNIFTGHIQP